MAKQILDSKWMVPNEVAVYVGCSPQHVSKAIDEGRLKAYVKPWTESNRLKYLIVHQDDVDAWIRSWSSAAGLRDHGE